MRRRQVVTAEKKISLRGWVCVVIKIQVKGISSFKGNELYANASKSTFMTAIFPTLVGLL